jgi:hypothetical protein
MTSWGVLSRELDQWQGAGRVATFWWRDDDATHSSAELDRLLAISGRSGVSVGLAVIPRDAEAGMHRRLDACEGAFVLQHGWSHANHAPADDRQAEFGPHRPMDVMLAELAEGRRRIASFTRGLPVLVAPWNRFDGALPARLPEAGIAAVSAFGPRETAEPAPGVRQTNVHVDIVDWQGSRGFVGESAALVQFVDHLDRRRRDEADAHEPTGLLTHHLFHDGGCWWFIEEVLNRIRSHPAARWLTAREAFWP